PHDCGRRRGCHPRGIRMTDEQPVLYRTAPARFDLGENRRLTFYPAVFDQPTNIVETENGQTVRYREVIRPGAFADSLARGDKVRATINHKEPLTFATNTDGSLFLQEDPH